MRIQAFLTPELLRELLHYDPETGIFRWMVDRSPLKAGDVAGSVMKTGYRKIRIRGVNVYAHRLAWFWVHDEWPPRFIDHRNGIPDDNRIANLRLADDTQNNHNRHRPQRRGTSGYLGVSPKGRKWMAQISVGGEYHYLGLHDTAEEAAAVYEEAKARLHPFWYKTA